MEYLNHNGILARTIDVYFAFLGVCLYPINVKTAEPIGPTFCVGHQLTPAVLRIQIRRIRKILASWNRIRENMRIHGSGSNGAKYQPETVKKITLKP